MTDDELREQVGRLVRQLVREDGTDDRGVTLALREHLGGAEPDALTVVTEELAPWEIPNLQTGLDALVEQAGWSVVVLGLAAHARHMELGLGDLVRGTPWGGALGAPEYVTVAVGPGRTRPCLAFGILLLTTPAGRIAVFVRRAQHGPAGPALTVQATTAHDGLAARLLADLREAMAERDVYRGQVLTVTVDPLSGSKVDFVERPQVGAEELVLPDGVLSSIERHVVGVSRHREQLLAAGRHLSRGLLLWGPPGTGKTHTVRHLLGLRPDATVIVLSGGALGAAGAFVTMARRLAPAVLVLEDVDLVAQERAYGPFGSSPVLFELMNQMDGLGGDADVAFVLTTNRADVLEPALAARPGRIDLAVELPLPDDDCRRRLLALYARGLDLRLDDVETIVARTAGVTASFLRELLRAAALLAAEEGRSTVVDADVLSTLDRLTTDGAALTRVLLGGERPGTGEQPAAHGWLSA